MFRILQRMNWNTVVNSRATFNDFFAEEYGRRPISLAKWAWLLLSKSTLKEMKSVEFVGVQNTGARLELLDASPEDAYPPGQRNRGKEDIRSLSRFLNLIEQGEKLPRVIIGDVDGNLIMLDGNHRAIAGSIKDVAVPIRIVQIPK